MKFIHLLLFVGLLTLANGCNTMRGAGQDVEAAGDEISETAREVQN